MDGVIVDSMPYHFISWYESLRPYKARVSCIEVFAQEGAKWDKALKGFLKKAGISPTRRILNRIFQDHKRIFKKYFKRFIFDGARELIKKIETKGYKLGLVTGTNARRVRKILPTDIFGMFDSIVTGDQVKQGKPHPGPYLKAARLLKVRPCDCVVIENAPYGIESAKRAGMFCIAITTSLPKEYLKKADVIINKLREVSSIV